MNIAESDPILVKLDVEGAEIEALRGARGVLSRDCMIVFEEYGEELECAVAQFVMHELALEVFFATDEGLLMRIRDIAQVKSLKKQLKRGYNFIATTKGTSFHRRLSDAIGRD